MEIYKIKNVNFTYPKRSTPALKNINLTVRRGEFVLLCGKSGCGKTTLLRLLKSSLSPFGNMEGEIFYNNLPLNDTDTKAQASEIGFVLQNPDSQLVTDKVWHELSFGLESLGCDRDDMRTRVAEMASFFGIESWFYKKVSELSGGQKQLLNLAAVMVMQPEVLILDEPTSQLDPIAATEFLRTIRKINDELGTTVILTEHRPEEAFAMADRVIVMDEGEIIADDIPEKAGKLLITSNHDMCDALPVPMRIFGSLGENAAYPLTIRDGKNLLFEFEKENKIDKTVIPTDNERIDGEAVIEVKDVFFRYEKNLPDVLKNFNLTVRRGEIFSILGGNGAGKSTAVSVISGINTPHRGKVCINGRKISEISSLYDGLLGVLPQNPQSLFANKTVYLDLLDVLDRQSGMEDKEKKIYEIASLCKIGHLLEFHPYDLSGGEAQRAALAIVLLKNPQILILDEPTKGMDAHFKNIFADIIMSLKSSGVTILMVSHDVEFCAEVSDCCALVFDGSITAFNTPRRFFSSNNFYTTSANRMARKLLPDAILAEDIIKALGGKIRQKPKAEIFPKAVQPIQKKAQKKTKLTKGKITRGILFSLLFCMTSIFSAYSKNNYFLQIASIICASLTISAFFVQKEIETTQTKVRKKFTKRTLYATVFILIAIPLTIYFGVHFLDDRRYYFISLLIILETLFPFCMVFENRKPRAREIVLISVLCAIAVAGRTAFFMLPEFKPVVALVIISGICFGGETGFLVGAICGFVSNFFFGQGPWTPWQMFAFGIIGLLSGIFWGKDFFVKTRLSLSVFGFIATLVLYGGIMNCASVLMSTATPTSGLIKAAFIAGFPIDLIHASSTAFFLWFLSSPMIEKLERIKTKYGLIDG